MNYSDVKKFGKTITVEGKPFVQLVDQLVDGMVRNRICQKAAARRSIIYYIEKGYYGGKMLFAMDDVRTLKALEAID